LDFRAVSLNSLHDITELQSRQQESNLRPLHVITVTTSQPHMQSVTVLQNNQMYMVAEISNDKLNDNVN